MRHRQRGRHLGRSSSHRRALLRNLVASLFLTEREDEYYDGLFQPDGKTKVAAPKQKGRIVTTWHKAKEVRPLVEKCITIAKKSLTHGDNAAEFESEAERGSEEWKSWRKSDDWRKWNEAMAPNLAARRHVLRLIGDKEAVSILFEEIAPRYVDRPGGYTRILRLAKPRLGDAGTQALLELVGLHERATRKSERPAFAADDTDEAQDETASAADEAVATKQSDEAGEEE